MTAHTPVRGSSNEWGEARREIPTAPAPLGNGHLWIVSNRLPVTMRGGQDGVDLVPSAGGISGGLCGFHRTANATWVGWLGAAVPDGERRRDIDERLAQERLVPVSLSAADIEGYYDGFSNGVLWPLLHYLLDRIPLSSQDWSAYRRVNDAFADTIAARYQPGDMIWVHDYHLMLLPGILRRRLPDARIGFFLHVPFPALEVFRILPWRRDILEGLLGANLIGFHTQSYASHFASALAFEFDLDVQQDRVTVGTHTVRLGSFPMGADVDRFADLAGRTAVMAEAERIQADAAGRAILVGVDRLDYTKGIPRRLLAFERLLERQPALRDRVRFIQVAVPSRESAGPYVGFRRQVEEIVGRISGSVSTVDSAPLHYVHGALDEQDLAALYLAADVMLVTPLRDGMNLVAKEFVASRSDEDGVLVLSEFAGAADELREALLVNPYDVDSVAAAMQRALEMEPAERTFRMRALRARLAGKGVREWASTFVAALEDAAPPAADVLGDPSAVIDRLRTAPELAVLLDYDGTLAPFTAIPDRAVPSAAILDLLRRLSERPGYAVHIVSGRSRDTLARWFGELDVDLWAEHGACRRASRDAGWEAQVETPLDWMGAAKAVLERFAAATPGALVEQKGTAVAWHYRMVEPQLAARRRAGLLDALAEVLRDHPADVLKGNKVVEVRPATVHKGLVVQRIGTRIPLLAIGDDRTDEAMFAAMSPGDVSVRVGVGPTAARYRVSDPGAVLDLLERLL